MSSQTGEEGRTGDDLHPGDLWTTHPDDILGGSRELQEVRRDTINNRHSMSDEQI